MYSKIKSRPTLTVSHPFLYVSCIYNNVIIQLNERDGAVIRQFGSEWIVNDVAANSKFLFLQGYPFITQLSSDVADLIKIYQITSNDINNLKLDENFIFYHQCIEYKIKENSWECSFPYITQRTIEQTKSSSLVNITFADRLVSNIKINHMENAPEFQENAATFKNLYVKTKDFLWQNSYFNPMLHYINKKWHILYYSGGGNAETGTYSDVYFHDISMFSIDDESYENNILIPIFARSVNPALYYPNSEYASAIITYSGLPAFAIHGGYFNFKAQRLVFVIIIETYEFLDVQTNYKVYGYLSF